MRIKRRGDFIDIDIGGNIEHVLKVAEAVRLAGAIIELADDDAGGWTSVEDDPPEQDKFVLITRILNGHHVRVPVTGRLHGDQWFAICWAAAHEVIDVTHWHKLPNFPTE